MTLARLAAATAAAPRSSSAAASLGATSRLVMPPLPPPAGCVGAGRVEPSGPPSPAKPWLRSVRELAARRRSCPPWPGGPNSLEGRTLRPPRGGLGFVRRREARRSGRPGAAAMTLDRRAVPTRHEPRSRTTLASLGARADRRDPTLPHDLGFARRDDRRGPPLPLDLGFARRTVPGRRGMSGGCLVTAPTVATPRFVAIVASLGAAAPNAGAATIDGATPGQGGRDRAAGHPAPVTDDRIAKERGGVIVDPFYIIVAGRAVVPSFPDIPGAAASSLDSKGCPARGWPGARLARARPVCSGAAGRAGEMRGGSTRSFGSPTADLQAPGANHEGRRGSTLPPRPGASHAQI